MILQDDVSRSSFGESGDRAVLALRQRRVHARRAEVKLDDLHVIQPVFAMVAAKDQPLTVPRTDRLQLLLVVGREQVVQRTGPMRRELVVFVE